MNEEKKDAVKELLEAISALCPLYDNGFLDTTINRILRKNGENLSAENLCTLTNRVRAAIRAVKDERGEA